MATPWNAVLKKFVSALFHPAAEAVDAWALDWNRWTDVYLPPPPSQVPKVLENIRLFQG